MTCNIQFVELICFWCFFFFLLPLLLRLLPLPLLLLLLVLVVGVFLPPPHPNRDSKDIEIRRSGCSSPSPRFRLLFSHPPSLLPILKRLKRGLPSQVRLDHIRKILPLMLPHSLLQL